MASNLMKILAFLLASSLMLSAPKAGAAKANGRLMEKKSMDRIEKLFEHTRTICIGRYVLDVPAEAQVIYGPAELPYPIQRIVGSGSNFDGVIEDRRRVIVTEERKTAWGTLAKEDSLLGKIIDGRVPKQKIVFGLSRATGAHYMLESYLRVGNDIYVQEAVAYGNGYDNELAELNSVAPLLVPRSDDQALSVPGICIEGAFLKEPTRPIYEYVTLGIRLGRFKDVHFSLQMTKKDQLVESDALEPRIRRAEVEARKSGAGNWYDRVKVFRRGSRKIGNWTGFEYLAWKPAIGDATESHVFAYVSQGVPNDPMLPVLDLAMDTGVDGNETSGTRPSLTNEEALFLWDRLTESIRPRTLQPAIP